MAITSSGNTMLAPVTLANALSIGAGQTLAVYLDSITGSNGIPYTGVGGPPPQTTWSNADLSLFSAVGRIGRIPFDGSPFSPRTFAGNVNYTAESSQIPEPGTISLLGAGLAGLVWIRRRLG